MAVRNGSNKKKTAQTALLIIDVINDLEFDGGQKVLPWAKQLTPRLKSFRNKARKTGMPVIYVNDNFGIWQGGFPDIVKHCVRKQARGAKISQALKPGSQDYHVLKPRHSAFFYTSLVPLLENLKIKHLVLSGIATNLCVLFTAHDAHMNKYKLTILSDCCAAESDFDHNTALTHLARYCDAEICKASEFKW